VLSDTRNVRIGLKVGQIGPKWDKSGTFSDQISVHFWPIFPNLSPTQTPVCPPVTSLEILQTSGFLRLLLHDLEELLVVDLVVFVLDPGDQKVRDELFVETEQRVFPGGS